MRPRRSPSPQHHQLRGRRVSSSGCLSTGSGYTTTLRPPRTTTATARPRRRRSQSGTGSRGFVGSWTASRPWRLCPPPPPPPPLQCPASGLDSAAGSAGRRPPGSSPRWGASRRAPAWSLRPPRRGR
ncbi:hypothetical protein PVAP13_6NG064240 [Panicum virgatum]|uniref:Uncharacterized protein n=1 Tax=Panicum virgatum TaxID=38727 RepID=A0A8T0QU42_PANVG|nr:hypothetical protein PVAP13_6NG064240 [Panicum virgatum]